jgi:hypothetical protein
MILLSARLRTASLWAFSAAATALLAGCGGSHGAQHTIPPATSAGSAPQSPAGAGIHVMRVDRKTAAFPGKHPRSYSGSGPLVYRGGQVMHNARVYVTYWGWNGDQYGEAPYLESYLNGSTGSAWLGIVTQYSDATGNTNNQSLEFGGSWHDNTNAIPTNPTDAQIQTEATASAAHFGNDPNGVYFVATPQGNWSPGFAYGNGSNGNWCSYHGYVGSVRYVNFPYQTDSQICTSLAQAHPGAAGTLDAVSVVSGHELAETINDPYLNAWTDDYGYEIGDKCAWINLQNASLWTGTFPVQPLFDNSVTDCTQPDVGPMYPQWNPGPALTNWPAVARNPDGRLEVVAADVNGTLWHMWQSSPNGGWTSWFSLGGSGALAPCTAVNYDGRLQAATVNADGTITQYWMTSVNGAWTSANIGGPYGGAWAGCAIALNTSGKLEVVVAGKDGNLYHAWQTDPGGPNWTAFWSLGNPGSTVNAGPAIARNQNGTLDAFVAAADNNIYHIAQVTPNGGWTPYTLLGAVPSGVAGRIAVAMNGDGRLEAFIGSQSYGPYHVWQSSAGGSWTGLYQVAPPPSGMRRVVAVGVNSPGSLEVFATTTSGGLWTSWQTAPSGGWTAWEPMGANQSNSPVAAVGPNADGRLELLTIQNDGFMYHTWEHVAGNGWVF